MVSCSLKKFFSSFYFNLLYKVFLEEMVAILSGKWTKNDFCEGYRLKEINNFLDEIRSFYLEFQ